MLIEKITSSRVDLVSFYNANAEGKNLFKKFSPEEFSDRFFSELSGYEKTFFAATENGKVIGIASGCIKTGTNVSYITLVLVDESFRRKGIGSALLDVLEADITTELTEKIEGVFYNPMSLPWIIPGTANHDHPGFPGVDKESYITPLLHKRGYCDYAQQYSYYRSLENYVMPDDISKIEAKAAEIGYGVAYYDKNRHFGIEELMDSLRSEGWRAAVLGNIAKENPLPLLVAEDYSAGDGKARAVGFTGPVTVQKSGRGYLAGIGVHPLYRGHGLGKLLFCKLCQANKDEGASFMSLFTGVDNPARHIYEAAGFEIVRSWACMRKTLTK